MKKNGLLFLTVCILLIGFVSCSSGSGPSEQSAVSSPLIGDASEEYYMVTFLSGIDYWKICFQGMEDAAKLYGVTPKYTGQIDADAAGQVAVLEQVIAMKPKGIALTCVDAYALADTINSAIAQGITVITFDSDSPTSNRPMYVSTDAEVAGLTAGQFMAPKVAGKQGKIAVVYTIGQYNEEMKFAAFQSYLAEHAPNIELVKVSDGGDTTKAADNMAAALQANSDIVGVFCISGISGSVVPTVVKEAGRRDQITVLTYDVDKAVLDMLKSGDIDATMAQGQYNMGYWSQVYLYHLAHGLPAEPPPGFVDTGSFVVTKNEADKYYIK
ncbi:substrate-binding domain-containing protein [Treponema sp. TIM-1]|uniref:substrate-binding domain-containing protein n=1 Tax=Treponema sp. TIM-1 TaxID=2898417 RepID=UPI003980BDDA